MREKEFGNCKTQRRISTGSSRLEAAKQHLQDMSVSLHDLIPSFSRDDCKGLISNAVS